MFQIAHYEQYATLIYSDDIGIVCLLNDYETIINNIPYTRYCDFEIANKAVFGSSVVGLQIDGQAQPKIYASIIHNTTLPTSRNQILFIPVEQGQVVQPGIFNYNAAYGYQMYTQISASLYDCEHMILVDSNHILYIPYNPKVSSLKTTILETKTDTIMGKYPFFVRNGNMRYKEIPLSGLISRQGDFVNSFGYYPEAIEETRGRDLTPSAELFEAITPSGEVYLERKHKLTVEEWLTNGDWKVLYTPTEGNYIVRLQNVSLAPNEQLGRRLHTFSATAIEIADYNETNLAKMGLMPAGSVQT